MVTSSGRSSSADDRSPRSRQPLWAAVRDDLESRIRSGNFSDTFPGELELSKQYGVSRSTIQPEKDEPQAIRDDLTAVRSAGN